MNVRARILTASLLALLLLAGAISCGTSSKVRRLRSGALRPDLSIADDYAWRPVSGDVRDLPRTDTVQVVDFDGRKVYLMNAIADENGEMVTHDVIRAAVVTARFRNIAERHGKVDLRFDVNVPAEMMDSRWQLRFHPRMTVLGETSDLESITITGADYRREQLRGYQLYRRYLNSIVTDTTVFINHHLLETFIRRNIPDLWKYRSDSAVVDPSQFYSDLGVTGRQAIEHYTNWFLVRRNRRRIRNIPRMYGRYVKSPIVTEGLRLDTVIANPEGGFTYAYVQTIQTRPRLKRADITLEGEVYDGPQRIYTIPRSEPISFYISSLSSFADPTERYLTRVVSRRMEASSACWVDFASGSSDIDLGLGHNASELSRIRANLRQVLSDEVFDLDSISVLASCSPEGSYASNARLAQARSEAVTRYLRSYASRLEDSLRRERSGELFVDWDGSGGGALRRGAYGGVTLPLRARSRAENWAPLDVLVREDTLLDRSHKDDYAALRSRGGDPDALERTLQGRPYYRRMREVMYPRLRTVEFTFHMHRRGMLKDTVHTTEPDTAYMAGVRALQERDYAEAIRRLRPYTPDYNLAVAYCAMDYNASALDILSRLERSDRVCYMLALLHAREGDDRSAVQCYLRSVELNPSYVHRGNLDPEISALITRYGLSGVIARREEQ